MKYFLIIIGFSIVLSANDMFCIQVISVKKEASITHDFMHKIWATDLPYWKESTDGIEQIFVGKFHTEHEAATALANVRMSVSKDAFLVKRKSTMQMEPKLKRQEVMAMAQARTLKKMAKDKPMVKALKSIEPIEVEEIVLQPNMVIERTDTKVIIAMEDEPETQEIFCKETKQELRESEIQKAIAFYRGSSYYTFNQGAH